METLNENAVSLCDRINNRNIILSSAATLFLKHGYHGASLNDISKLSRIDKGSTYYHFGNKVHIAQSLLESVIKFYDLNLLNLSHNPENLRGHQLAVKFIDQLIDLINQGHVWLLFVLDFDLDELPTLKPQIDKIIEQWINSIKKLIKPVDYSNMTEAMTAHVSFEMIIAVMRNKNRGKNINDSKICLKRLLKLWWLN